MKKYLLVFLCLIIIVMSCEFSIPQSITIKGSPQFLVPIGSLFALFGEDGNVIDDFLEIISTDSISEMMGSSDRSITAMYDYRGSDVGTTQAYLFHYPITEMNLNLHEYVASAMTDADGAAFSAEIPDEATSNDTYFSILYPNGVFLTSTGGEVDAGNPANEAPLFLVDLSDMKRLVVKVEGDEFGLKLENYDPSLKDNLHVKIPALGINDYVQGVEENGELRFISADKEFNPSEGLNEDGKLEIYVKITAACSGTIAPLMVFEWTSATVNTADMTDGLAGAHDIDINLGDALGAGIALKRVEGYIYVGGLQDGTDATMTLKVGNTALVEDEPLTGVGRPDFGEGDIFSGNIPANSLGEPIDLTAAFNAANSSNLEYTIRIGQMEIEKDNVQDDMKIFADFVILLSLELTINTPSGIDGYENYVKLNLLDGLIPDMEEEEDSGDLLGRTGSEDDLLNNLEWVRINFNNFKNDIFDADLVIVVVNYDEDGQLNYSNDIPFGSANSYLEIDMDELPNPFNPKFEVLLKKDENAGVYEDYATLKIKRMAEDNETKFDFFLTVEVKTDLNIDIPL